MRSRSRSWFWAGLRVHERTASRSCRRATLTATGSAKTATTSANGTDIVNGDRVLAGCD